jgi:hypothetical protein
MDEDGIPEILKTEWMGHEMPGMHTGRADVGLYLRPAHQALPSCSQTGHQRVKIFDGERSSSSLAAGGNLGPGSMTRPLPNDAPGGGQASAAAPGDPRPPNAAAPPRGGTHPTCRAANTSSVGTRPPEADN